MVTQSSFLMLGNAVSSNIPSDCQPNSQNGSPNDPRITFRAIPAPPGMAYIAVGIKRAVDSAIGLPRRPTNALPMLALLIPADVRRSFICFLVSFKWLGTCFTCLDENFRLDFFCLLP